MVRRPNAKVAPSAVIAGADGGSMPMMAAQVRAMAAGPGGPPERAGPGGAPERAGPTGTAMSTATMSSALVVRAAWAALAAGSSSQNQASRGDRKSVV